MYNSSILDSNRLINLKNQHGLKIATGNSLSVYSAQNKLRKLLIAACSPLIHGYDLNNLVDKIVDRCDDAETVNLVTDYFNNVPTQEFIDNANGKIRAFFKTVKNYGTLEFQGNPNFSA